MVNNMENDYWNEMQLNLHDNQEEDYGEIKVKHDRDRSDEYMDYQLEEKGE